MNIFKWLKYKLSGGRKLARLKRENKLLKQWIKNLQSRLDTIEAYDNLLDEHEHIKVKNIGFNAVCF